MLSDQELANEVDRILWEEWDPIGVNDEPAARNEYSSYVAAIAHLLQGGADETQIARHLKSIEDVSITVGVYDDRRKRVARMLVELRNAG